MVKLCGFKEKCFVNGEKQWGHWGGSLCAHSSETKKADGASVDICGLTDEEVTYYDNVEDYNRLKVK